ncbi:MAG: DUF11 domain-containing protein [Proteobacteria bacterium]|nr:DUF11 domain-containing protein [Pseudomonadota bacterium]
MKVADCGLKFVALLIAALAFFSGPACANQVTNPYFTGTATTATGWTSSAAGAGAAFNHALSAPNAAITAAGGSTEFYSGCVGAACLTYPLVSGTTSGAQQTVSTNVGQKYTITFWAYFSTANSAAVEIDVYWGSTKIYAGTSVAAAGWQQKTISLGAATQTSNTVTVMIRDDPNYSGITGIDVYPVGPNVSVTKTSSIISDTIDNVTNPKAIPGAVLEYCIVVSNTGVASADSVVATDTLPANLAFVAGSIRSGTTCANSITAGGATFAGSTLTANIGTLAASSAFAVKFQATVN